MGCWSNLWYRRTPGFIPSIVAGQHRYADPWHPAITRRTAGPQRGRCPAIVANWQPPQRAPLGRGSSRKLVGARHTARQGLPRGPGPGVHALVGSDFVEIASPQSYCGAPLAELAPPFLPAPLSRHRGWDELPPVPGSPSAVRGCRVESVAAMHLTAAPPSAHGSLGNAGIDVRAHCCPSRRLPCATQPVVTSAASSATAPPTTLPPWPPPAPRRHGRRRRSDLYRPQTGDHGAELHTILTIIGLARQAPETPGHRGHLHAVPGVPGQLLLPLGVRATKGPAGPSTHAAG